MISLQAAVLALAAVTSSDAVLLDFYADWCGPCQQMARTVEQLAAQGYPIRKVNVDQDRQLAAQYRVQGIPCFVLVVDGREVDRIVGAASSDSLKRMFDKAGAGPDAKSAPNAPAVPNMPAAPAGPPRGLDAFIGQTPAAPAAMPSAVPASMTGVTASAPLSASAAPPRSEQPSAATSAIRADLKRLLAASVRLKIEDATGHAFGSGTIIDTRGDQALILTCGHIFRDSAGRGRITVDMFGPGAPRDLEGQVVGYDEDRDVGLVSFRPGVPVTPVRLAVPGSRVSRGEPVVSIGCDNGADPSARESRIAAIDKYLGPPNLEVSGQPVQGRSGGGLFDANGQLIGVCNAADPSDDEGLFAALASVHALLQREGLSSIAGGRESALAAGNQTDPLAPLVAVRPPQMPGSMPRAMPDNLPLTSSPDQLSAPGQAGLSAGEQAALSTLQSQSGAEVVCVIRSLDDPRAKSRIIVLDRASPDFMHQLAAEQRKQEGRHLTSLAQSPPAERPIRVVERGAGGATAKPESASLSWAKPGVR